MRTPDIRKTVVIALILIHLSALLLEVAPFKPKAYPGHGFFAFYLQSTALWQDWSMFSPDPLRLNLHVEAKVRYRNGRETTYALPRLHQLPLWERVVTERVRPWAVAGLRMDEPRHIWADGAQFILREIPRIQNNPVESIRLFRLWHEIEDPRTRFREWGYRVPDPELTGYEFHTLQIPDAGGGR